jgi:hypothetical protein
MNVSVNPANVNNNSSTIEVCPPFDRDTIETHLGYLHHAADRAKVPGKLVLAVYGEDPDTQERFGAVEHFAIGDVEGMTNAAMKYDGVPNRNVYAPFAIMSPDLKPRLKGREIDVRAVLALVIDGDADKGKERPTAPVPADYIIESSAGNFQEVLFLLKPLKPDEAKPLARALQRATKAEFADDLCHVWRVPGCLNWPGHSKVHDPKRNRSRTPQLVTVNKPWKTWTTTDALRKAVAEHWEQPRAEATPLAPRGTFDNCPIKIRAFHERLRDAGYYDRDADDLETTRLRWLHAAKALSYDLGDAGRTIWEEVVCWKGTRADEGTAVDTGEADYRWHDCSRLREGAAPITHGSLIDDAKRLYQWKGLHLERDKPASEMFAAIPPQTGQGMATAAPVGYTGPVPPTSDEAKAAAKAALDALPDELDSSGKFADDFEPFDYIIDGIFLQGFIYSITSQTGGGKTANALLIAADVATARPYCGRDIEQGQVIYLAGENYPEVRMRWLGLTQELEIDPKVLDVHFRKGAKNLADVVPALEREIARKGLKPKLIVVDTAAAFFGGEDDNHNVQMGAYARQLRTLCSLPGNPCVLVLCHPTKGAKDLGEMTPRGGGAFIAEMDGNCGQVKDSDTSFVMAKVGKFRGPEFLPLNFALKGVTHPKVVTTKGKLIPTVIAVPISADEAERREEKSDKDDDKVLKVLCDNGAQKQAHVAKAMDWRFRTGGLNDKAAGKALTRLAAEGLATETKGYWTATPKGQKYLNAVATAQPAEAYTPLTPANLGPAPYPMPAPARPPMPPK